MTFGLIHFAAPLALLGLLALPLLWLVLRAAPPAPVLRVFPPLRLLLGLRTPDQARARAPLWLVLFRMAILALAILGFARPSFSPPALAAGDTPEASGRVLLVVDDGWTLAPAWSEVRAAMTAIASDIERAGGEAHLLLTAPAASPISPAEALTPGALRGRAAQLEPQAWRPDRADAAQRIETARLGRFARIVWVSDGLQDAGAQRLATALRALGPVTVQTRDRPVRAITDASVSADGVRASLIRAPGAPPDIAVAAETAEGRSLGVAEGRFDGQTAEVLIQLPAEIAARAARVRIVGEDSAGGQRLLPDGAARPNVGLIESTTGAQPLLSEIYYVERALSPYATMQRGTVAQLIDARVQALVLPDASRLAPQDAQRLTRWLESGGLLLRFAGPRLANDADDLTPVRLRSGARTLGGALAWEEPQKIAPFASTSPFAGLMPPEDIAVRRQLLAIPGPELEERTWARLSDGSPLVTAAPRGRGLIVLFHVSAGPDWSDLPLSGLYVEMLRRTLAFAGRGQSGTNAEEVGAGPFVPTRLIDGFGTLRQATGAQTIPPEVFAAAAAGPASPPGLYERAGLAAAIPVVARNEQLQAIGPLEGVTMSALERAGAHPLAGILLSVAAIMTLLDLFVSLWLAGRLPTLARLPFKSASLGALLLLALVPVNQAHAQNAQDPTLSLRLAYVVTGDARTDRMSREGLTVLSQTLFDRTSVEPTAPAAVNLATDDLSAYPFIYWPAAAEPSALSDNALANVDRYLRLGGLLLVDTRDATVRRTQGEAGPAATMLRGLDAPPLAAITAEHVVARSFYILRSFPGRYAATQLWAETESSAAARDGVASLFVGNGDWATAWAGDGGVDTRQRELALRFGVNLVMVALTGNYKADQVHLPALLERLGREGRR
ncbi:MAG: DUF4159 domain-containing protein [Caulobacterales bacterium]